MNTSWLWGVSGMFSQSRTGRLGYCGDVSQLNTEERREGKRTFDVKCCPKAISSPCSSACLIVLSCANPLAAIHSLPAQKAHRKLFDHQSTTRSSKPWTHGSMMCKYTKFNNVHTDTTSVGGERSDHVIGHEEAGTARDCMVKRVYLFCDR